MELQEQFWLLSSSLVPACRRFILSRRQASLNMSNIGLNLLNSLKAVWPDAVVSVVVNLATPVTVTGLISGVSIARALAHGALTNTDDFSIWVASESFPNLDILNGKTITITRGSTNSTARIMSTRLQALGGVVQLMLGSYERVTS